jgi:hypothetical protein
MIAGEPGAPMIYQIRLRGHLGARWSTWFEDLTVVPEPGGNTLMIGPVIDQAALYGVLAKIRDLGLPLLSIACIDPEHDTNH